MKNQRQFQALLVTIITLLFLAPLAIAGTIETYIFINKQQDIEDYRSPQKLVELLEWRRTKFADDTRFADEELEEQSLPQGDETHLVIGIKRLAVWFEPLSSPPKSVWSPKINTSDRKQREALAQLDKHAKLTALQKALSEVNSQTASGLSHSQITELADTVLEDFRALLVSTNGYKELDPRKRDKTGVFSGDHCIVSSYYFRFDKERLFDLIQPSPIALDLVVPKLGTDDFISKDTIRFTYTKTEKLPAKTTDKSRQDSLQQAFNEWIQELAKRAYEDGSKKVNDSLPEPLPVSELLSFIAQFNYGNYVEVASVGRQEIERKFVSGRFDETLHLEITFHFARDRLLNELAPPPEKTNFAGPKINPADFSSEKFHVVKFEDKTFPMQGPGQEVFAQAIEKLSRIVFDDAVVAVNKTLDPPLPVEVIAEFIQEHLHNFVAGDEQEEQDELDEQKDFLLYTQAYDIRKQEITRLGFKKELHLSVYFYFARDRLLNELAPPPEKTNFAGPKINPADFSSEKFHVVKFENEPFAMQGPGQEVFDRAIEDLSRAAFRDAVVAVNKTQRNPQTNAAIGEFIQEHLENYVRGEEQRNFQIYTQTYDIRKQEIARRLGLKDMLHLSVYFYFERKKLGDALRPPLEVIPLDRKQYADTDAHRVPLSSAVTLVIPFELEEASVPQEVEDREMARRQAYTKTIQDLARKALVEALSRVNADLDSPVSAAKLDQLINSIGSDYRNYTLNREVTHQAITRRGSAVSAQETLQLTMHFYFDRLQIKDLILPAERSITVTIDTRDVLRMDVPAGDDKTYVAVFRDHEVEVPSDVQDKNAARSRTARKAVEALKRKAFQQAADDINHQLAQPMNPEEFERAVAKTSANFQNYVIDFKWIDAPQVITRGDYSTESEKLRLNLYFQVDRKALRKALISERAITLVGRYRTYAELYWNVPGKFEDFPPEMLKETTATVLENIEDYFSAKDYEVVEFENIRGELIKLLNAAEGNEGFSSISEDDLYSQDEYTRLQSNLALRCISKWSSGGVSWQAQQGSQSQFEFGKRILADYADLLIGVTINSIEPSSDGRQVTLRLTLNATLFERGEWIKLASSDASRSLPYEPGSINLLIEGGKMLSRQLAADLEPKIKHKLARRKAAEEVLTGTEQVFIVIFKGASKQQFASIKSRLTDSNRWEYKSTDVRNRTARIAFEGSIDNFADRLEMFLSGAGLSVGLPEYVSSQRRIIFEVAQ